MKKIPLSQQGKHAGKYFALVDDEDYEKLNKYLWTVSINKQNKYGYRNIYLNGNRVGKIYMHQQILNSSHISLVDHIDGDGLNNQKFNLRKASLSQNQMNKNKHSNNKSGFKGVWIYKRDKKFVSQISKNNKTISVGYFDSAIEAAKAYNKKALELFGEFAKLNIIPGENAS